MIEVLSIIAGVCLYIIGFGFTMGYITSPKTRILEGLGADLAFFASLAWPFFWLIYIGVLLGEGVAKE